VKCVVCQEEIPKFYDDEQEEWMIKAIVQNDQVQGLTQHYHVSCYQDLHPEPPKKKVKSQ
jgi:hypothetical protein